MRVRTRRPICQVPLRADSYINDFLVSPDTTSPRAVEDAHQTLYDMMMEETLTSIDDLNSCMQRYAPHDHDLFTLLREHGWKLNRTKVPPQYEFKDFPDWDSLLGGCA